MIRSLRYVLLLVHCMVILSSCSQLGTNPLPSQSIVVTFHNLPPTRDSQVYVLWFEVPKSSASKQTSPLHGTNISKIVSTFTVDSLGVVHGFDTTGLSVRIGLDYALIVRAELSIERADSIRSIPTSILLVNELTGTVHVGTATLNAFHPYAFGPQIASIGATATFASGSGGNTASELYLMNATSASNASAGISNFVTLTAPWQYGLWTIDSDLSPPAVTFLGYITDPNSKDTKSTDDSYNFPGGRSPSDPNKPGYDLTGGHSYIEVTAEPSQSGPNPSVPFRAVILSGQIPKSQTQFSPFQLSNLTGGLPTIDLTIYR